MLSEKYNPIYASMQDIVGDKRLDYMTFLTKQLNQNKARVKLEKDAFEKLSQSFNLVSDKFKSQLEE
jgi:hypothetical protein